MPKPKSRISKITVARLYNMGNYEHLRIELTAEIPEGNSAKLAMSKIASIVRGLNPKPPCTRFDLERAKESLSKPLAKMTEMDHINATHFRSTVERYEQWRKGNAKAMELLEKFGGKADLRDAKVDFDPDCPF